MRFTPVDEVPKPGPKYFSKNNGKYLYEFLKLNIKRAKMEYSDLDYAYPYSAYAATRSTAKYYNLPVSVHFVNNEIYLVRTDMEG